jgi:endonuclease YncB( thermonuclease family)
MQRDVEIEIETTDKSGGFIGALYLNKNENAAVTLVSEGYATVHAFSADTLPWAKQLYDAEVGNQMSPWASNVLDISPRKRQKKRSEMYACILFSVTATCQLAWADLV